ncbi:TIGR03086 family protein [Gordonia sp. CPCC 206044]|uniref:TIGR03086 family protein n=1 Tax=Gordonia sp. CPCC 206044 TaxID=3140793 RepID=UPI003AF34B78
MSDVGSIGALTPAARHRVVAGTFAEEVAAVTDWEAESPVQGWTARDVVGHLVEWFPGFLAAGGVDLAPGPSVGDDPVRAWHVQTAGVQELLDGPDAGATFRHPMAGEHRLADAVDRFYTADVFMHTWDLAAAGGRVAHLDPAYATQLLDGMRGIEDLLRSSGQYGPAVPVDPDADPVTRLMGFIGRDPSVAADATHG